MPHVVCVGDLMVDVVAQLPGPLAPGSDTPARIGLHAGGAAANVAAWVVASGGRATMVGRVGDDVLGRQTLGELRSAGVDTSITVDRTRPTGTCIVLVAPDGERTMVPDAGANAGLSEQPADALPEPADCLYLSGYALLGSGSRPFALDALRVARERGWTIAVDAASAAPLALTGAGAFFDWIGSDVLLLANRDEALVLAGLDEPSAAAQALALRCGRAIVKRGAAGAVWSNGSGVWSTPAIAAELIDSTGAGDAFAAGFLTAHLGGASVGPSLAAGAATAARAVSQAGARPR